MKGPYQTIGVLHHGPADADGSCSELTSEIPATPLEHAAHTSSLVVRRPTWLLPDPVHFPEFGTVSPGLRRLGIRRLDPLHCTDG